MRTLVVFISLIFAALQTAASDTELKQELNQAAVSEQKKIEQRGNQNKSSKKKDGTQTVKKFRYKKTQEVSFDSENVDGVVRNPYGAYLTQKKGMEFAPLYRVRERFDENIKDSVHYMKVAK